MDRDLNPYVLEVNANPDIRSDGDTGFIKVLLLTGRSYADFVTQLIEMALARKLR